MVFNFGGPIMKDKLFFFVDYEGFRQVLKPLSVLTLPTQNEMNGILVVPVKNPTTGAVYQPGAAGTRRFRRARSIRCRRRFVSYFKQIRGCRRRACRRRAWLRMTMRWRCRLRTMRTRAICGWTISRMPSSSWFLRVSDRKETGVNYPGDSAAAGWADERQRSGCWTSRWRWGIRICLERTRCWMRGLGCRGRRRASIRFRLATMRSRFRDCREPGGLGRLPSVRDYGLHGFGRQSTNPQWQDPSLLDPKVNFTWVKGNHSLKFGYEYEHIWMAVNDNNPLYGSFTYAAVRAPARVRCGVRERDCDGERLHYWADFLFGTTNNVSLANYFVAHLRQTMDNAYAQDDWKVNSKLTLNLGLRWEYGSPYSEQHNYISNFDPATQTVLTITPGATAGQRDHAELGLAESMARRW
jgi:hypothetical protein